MACGVLLNRAFRTKVFWYAYLGYIVPIVRYLPHCLMFGFRFSICKLFPGPSSVPWSRGGPCRAQRS